MSTNSNIHAAINRVMEKVAYVQKTGQMKGGGNYKYASESGIIATIRPAMVEEGIVMYPAGIHDLRVSNYPTKNSTMNHVVAIYTWVFAHAESGTQIEVATLGEGADVGDKSGNKSMTAAKKYALLQTFLIETGNDPDDTSSQDMQRSSQDYAAQHPDLQNRVEPQAPTAAPKIQSPNTTDGAMELIGNILNAKRDQLEKKGFTRTEFVELTKPKRIEIMMKLGEVFADDNMRYGFQNAIGFPDSVTKMDRAQRSTMYALSQRRDAKKIIKLILDGNDLFADRTNETQRILREEASIEDTY